MKILIAGLTTNIQFKRLKEEGEKRGHTVAGCRTDDLVIYSDTKEFSPEIIGGELSAYDLIYSFATKRRWEWYLTFLYLNKKYKTRIVNERIVKEGQGVFLSPVSIVDYYRQTREKINYPASVTFHSEKGIDEVLSRLSFPMIVKSSVGKQGKAIFKVENEGELDAVIKKLKNDKDAIVARKFIANDGDIRVFVIGGKAVVAMRRIPKKGDFRSNISQGASGKVFDINKYPKITKLAENAAKATRMDIAGVDIVLNKTDGLAYVLEVNANPQFAGLERFTGINIAKKIIEYFETLA